MLMSGRGAAVMGQAPCAGVQGELQTSVTCRTSEGLIGITRCGAEELTAMPRFNPLAFTFCARKTAREVGGGGGGEGR